MITSCKKKHLPMKQLKNILTITVALFIGFTIGYYKKISELLTNKPVPKVIQHQKDDSPISIKMYNTIREKSREYQIPTYIAFNIAYLETRYRGPFDSKYNPALTSSVGAVGPMQLRESTAEFITKRDIDNEQLKNDISLNVEISMKLLKYLYDRYGSWEIACSYYNTGKAKKNSFGSYCVENVDYTYKWENYNKTIFTP